MFGKCSTGFEDALCFKKWNFGFCGEFLCFGESFCLLCSDIDGCVDEGVVVNGGKGFTKVLWEIGGVGWRVFWDVGVGVCVFGFRARCGCAFTGRSV